MKLMGDSLETLGAADMDSEIDAANCIDSRGVKEARNQMVAVIYLLTRQIAGNSRLLPAVKWSFDDFLHMQMAT